MIRQLIRRITENTREAKEMRAILSRLGRLCICCAVVVVGVVCSFTFPEPGFNVLGSATWIAGSYFFVLFYPNRQWMEFFILACVIAVTAYAYVFPETLNGSFFLAQLLYFFYVMVKFLFFKVKIMKGFGKWFLATYVKK